jgi:hypothetical protein
MSNKVSLIISDKERPNLISLFKSYVKRRVKEETEKWEKYYREHPYRGYEIYDDDYDEDMARLRRFYGMDALVDEYWDEEDDDEDDTEFSEYNYEVDDDGTIVFPPQSGNKGSEDVTLRPGQYRRSAQDMDDYWNKMAKFNSNGKHKHVKHRGKRGNKHKRDINEPYNANFIDDADDIISQNTIYFYPDYHDKYERLEFNSLVEFDEYCNEEGFVVPPYVGEILAYSTVSHCCLRPDAKEQGILEVMREDTYGDMFYEACETSELSAT